MTSRISFISLTKEAMKRGAAFGILLLAGYFCYYPIGLLLLIGDGGFSGYAPFNPGEIIKGFGLYLIRNPLLFFITAVSAVVLGILQFQYLHSQGKLDLYHSLPVRREKLFGAQYCAGLLLWFLPFLGNLLVAWIICLLGGTGFILLPTLLTGLFAHICCFLLSYGTAVLAVMLTGKLFASVAGIAVFFSYIPMASLLATAMLRYYFTSFSSGNMGEFGLFCTPVYLVWHISELLMAGEQYPLNLVLAALLIGALAAGISICLYRVRPSEAAGNAMVFPAVARVVKFMLTLPAALASALLFYLLGNNNKFWGIFGCIFGLLLVSAVIEFVYCMDIREVLRDRKQIVFTGAAALAILCVLQFDLFGYDRWLPDAEELFCIRLEDSWSMGDSRVNFYVPDVREDTYRFPADAVTADMETAGETETAPAGTEDPDGETYGGDSYMLDRCEYAQIICTGEQLDAMLDVIRQSNVFTGNRNDWFEMDVVYQMRDGRVKRRRYYYEDTVEKLAPIWEEEKQKREMYPVLGVEPDDLFAVQVDGLYSEFQFVSSGDAGRLAAAQKEKLLETFQKELLQASYAAFLEYSDYKVNFVYRAADGGLNGESFSLNKAFPETKKLLQEYGYLPGQQSLP